MNTMTDMEKDTRTTARLLDKLAESRPVRVREAGKDRKGYKQWQFR
jgi:hypothetical protein